MPLNDTGHSQAKAVARALQADLGARNGSRFMASPMTRTRQTMGHISKTLGITEQDVVIDPLLKELGFGIWEGKPFWELKASPVYPADPETRYSWRPEGGESYEDGAARVKELLTRLAAPTIVVSHGALGRCLIGQICGLRIRDLVGLRMPQGCYCRLSNSQADWFDANGDAA